MSQILAAKPEKPGSPLEGVKRADLSRETSQAGNPPPAALVEGLVFDWPSSLFRLEIGSLAIGPGERIFLSGPSGGGKSTLLALMAGILAPKKGSVSIGGESLSSLSPSARDKLRGEKIGIIFQRFNLVPYLSALENVLLPLRLNPGRRALAERRAEMEGSAGAEETIAAATVAAATGAAKDPAGAGRRLSACAESLLARLGLDESVWRRPSTTLSVGQSQRVAAARALIGSPPLVLADEPTSSLDEDARVAFLRTLIHECGEAGAGLLFVSHDRRLATEFGRVARLVKKDCATIFEEVSRGGESQASGEAGDPSKMDGPGPSPDGSPDGAQAGSRGAPRKPAPEAQS